MHIHVGIPPKNMHMHSDSTTLQKETNTKCNQEERDSYVRFEFAYNIHCSKMKNTP